MEQVARDLGAWMELAPGTRQEIVDVSDLVTRFRLAVADELDAQDEHARQIQGAASAIELVSNLTRRYDNAIGELRVPRTRPGELVELLRRLRGGEAHAPG